MQAMRKAKTIKKQLREIIKQGNNIEIQALFVEIVQACRDEFTEDNEPTLSAFLTENLYNAFVMKDPTLRDFIRPAMIGELSDPSSIKRFEPTKMLESVKLKLINTYKVFFEQSKESRTLYEWSNGEKSYFTQFHDHHYLDMTGEYCLGNTVEEATARLKKQIEETN